MDNLPNLTLLARTLLVTGLTVAIASCKTTNVSHQVNTCGCGDYFVATGINEQAFAQEIISEQIYQASGSAFCTGLKQTDIDNADKAARENLAKLISVKVETEEFSKIGSPGYGVTIREYLQNTNLESKLTVQGSYIAHRWVDKNYCTINSAVRVSSENAKLSLESAEHGLNNASFYIKTSGNSLVDNKLLEYFVAQGVSKISSQNSKQQYRVEPTLVDVKQKSKKDLSLTLQIKIIDQQSNQVRELFSAQGKGITYKNLSYSALYNRAVEDALYEIQGVLAKGLK